MALGDAVLLEIEADGPATITLNQPDRRNALSAEISAGITEALDEIEGSDARCVVIEGSGGSFSAGGDIERMIEAIEDDVPADERVRRLERSTNELMTRLVDFPIPTIAAIDGPAVGAGANLAIACDVQLASESAAFGFVFRQVGLSVDAGTSYLLPRIVGENVAKELVLTGEIFGTDRATELGLVNHVYDDDEFDEKVDEFVETVVSGPPIALRHANRLVGEGLDKSLEQALTDEAVAQGIVFETADHAEGVNAFLEDRDPEFDGR
ncbi:enoyl-CoA hydratase-related protein [Natronolimnohabitans innermongolicus]|uniref:Enoyl-CoA hydratase/isomerase n=1 Tax=Natronolimnohabitans innermongolicus JCM 12255 TaxID=1227499 RepID=L9XJF5_9EURY|nr:enoyl-CoA hydratase-related protein [Natronolimnohabitans innermongolicus]ELY61894.1 enoyl-CoA hydratase/isomerase [Natronolimnohabitans innermongolicus JCM 12255]